VNFAVVDGTVSTTRNRRSISRRNCGRDFPAARPTLDAVHTTEDALARKLAEDEATAVQEPRVLAEVDRLRAAGNARAAGDLARQFFGGGLSRVVRSAVAARLRRGFRRMGSARAMTR
jgi:hypothetical protein